MKNQLIPAITNVKDLEYFLTLNHDICVVMSIHVSMLKRVVERLKAQTKTVWLHLDLIPGLSSDEHGAEYAIQYLKVDGIVSTKTSAIKAAKKKKITAIFRIFLIDSASMDKSLARVDEINPDYVEFLPALAHRILPIIQDRLHVPVIGGGLIQTQSDIDDCYAEGMVAVTVSKTNLW
jgi:Glycerol-3-phosphate responsive antiterminator (mRNA-binding)